MVVTGGSRVLRGHRDPYPIHLERAEGIREIPGPLTEPFP